MGGRPGLSDRTFTPHMGQWAWHFGIPDTQSPQQKCMRTQKEIGRVWLARRRSLTETSSATLQSARPCPCPRSQHTESREGQSKHKACVWSMPILFNVSNNAPDPTASHSADSIPRTHAWHRAEPRRQRRGCDGRAGGNSRVKTRVAAALTNVTILDVNIQCHEGAGDEGNGGPKILPC